MTIDKSVLEENLERAKEDLKSAEWDGDVRAHHYAQLHVMQLIGAISAADAPEPGAARSQLPSPYVEVFIFYGGQRRVARLDASQQNYQLSTFLTDTKGQYSVRACDVEKWEPISSDTSQAMLISALKMCAAVCSGQTLSKRSLTEALEAASAALNAAGLAQ